MTLPIMLVAGVAGTALPLSTLLTIAATLLVGLLAVGSALGGVAAFRTGRTNAIAASAVARAGEAEATASTWRGRLEAVQAEFAAYKEDISHQRGQDQEAVAAANHEIAKLKSAVATLEGVVTARKEVTELISVVTSLAQTVRADHERQHMAHEAILAAVTHA